jgi:hypothetical protein
VRKSVELSVTGQNLLQARHVESVENANIDQQVTEVQRGVYGKVTWKLAP